MSMALWAAYQLDDGTVVWDEDDKCLMLEYMDELDYLCETFQVSPLSSLLDTTDVAHDVLDEHDIELMDMMGGLEEKESSWVHPHDAIHILDTLYSNLSTNPELFETSPEHVQDLLEEIQSCLNTAQAALEQSERFNLTLVS